VRPDDSTADDWILEFLNFGVGVLSLVCLSCSVIWGLVAQDRVLLGVRQRIMAQAVHRTTAVASILFLLVHIAIKLILDHTSWIAAAIPFGLALTDDEVVLGRTFLIGLGTIAAMLMIFVGITGILRNRFATPAPVAARWRAMHMLAYPAWCAALVHGLYAGRAAKPIFMILYGLSVLGVTAALVLRASPRSVKRRVADGITGFLGITEDQPRREELLEESRSRAAEATLPGYEGRAGGSKRDDGPRFEKAERPAAAEPANGFAAAYRAVSAPPQTQQMPQFTDQTATSPLDLQSTGAMPQVDSTGSMPRMDSTGGIPQVDSTGSLPRVDSTGSMPRVDSPSSTSGNWPIPSPPPVGEAPPSAYDPLNDTGYTIPAYNNPGGPGYGSSDVYDTGETNTLSGTYNPSDTYNSGPATETLPGASSSYDFDAPGSGEPWNMPSGGYK